MAGTARNRTEGELQFRNLLLATQQEVSLDGILIVDAHGQILSHNSRFVELFGIPQEVMDSRSDERALKSAREKLADPERFLEKVTWLYQHPLEKSHDEIALQDGRTLERYSAPMIGPDGQSLGRVWYFRDITERQRAEDALRASEERFRTLLDSMEDAVLTMDRDGRCTSVSAKALERRGLPLSAFLGKPVADFFGPEVGAKHEPMLARVLQGEHVVYECQHETEGKRRVFQTSDSPLRDPQGNVVGAVRIARDVTELKKMQEQLLLSERMTSMGMLAAGVAHEINNPLAAVMGNLDFTLRELGSRKRDVPLSPADLAEVEQALRESRGAAERVRQIVRDLKVFSRPDEKQQGLIEVRRLLESSLRMVWNEIRHRAQLVKLYDAAPLVFGNEARLGQVFLNLIVNAAQAMPEGQADRNRLTVSTYTEASGRAVVEVRDTGCGIAPEIMGLIFEPFFTTKPIGVGTGLGLPICQRIVTDLGGTITVESEVGKGSCFRVVLPAESAEAGAAAPAAAPVPAGRRGRILVIDDDPMVAKALTRILSPRHEVAATTRGREALELLAAGARFDLILCDLMMPEMTGMDLHGELARVAPEETERMVFLTGGAFTPRAQEFLDRVSNLRVEKPIDAQSLLALIDSLLR